MPKSWKEAAVATLIITFVATLLSLALWQTEKTNVAETLRTSGFVDEAMTVEGEDSVIPGPADIIGIAGFTVRQILQIIIPLLITLRILKTTRQRARSKLTGRKRPIAI